MNSTADDTRQSDTGTATAIRVHTVHRHILLELAKREGESLGSIADQTGHHRTLMSKWLNGRRPMPFDVLCQVAALLRTRPDVLAEFGAAPDVCPTCARPFESAA